MKTKNLSKLFFLMFALAAFTTNAQGIKVSKWQMHKGIDKEPIQFETKQGYWGDPAAYVKKNIPTQNDSGWKTVDEIKVDDKSTLIPFKQLDFTYFQRTVHIPKGTKITKFEIEFKFVDDGARVYVFNDKHSEGAFQPGTDWTLKKWNDNGRNIDFVIKNFGELLTEGNNRIVIVQFDNHKGGNVVKGVKMVVKGENNGKSINQVTPTNKTVQQMETPKPVGHWTFENSSKKDKIGNFGDLVLFGNPHLGNGQLYVRKDAFAESKTYTGPNIKEKTLVAWAMITDTIYQGGSILTIGKPTNNYDFDAIVFGERENKTWMAGSGWFNRTQDLGYKGLEKNIGSLVKIAITYKLVNGNKTEVTIYRNDIKLGSYIKGNMLTTFKNGTGVMFGKRHFYPQNPNKPFLSAAIEEARVYNQVLTLDQLKQLKIVK